MRILNKKEFSKTIQSPKGITIIALIITVIVMLILAAVAIYFVSNSGGNSGGEGEGSGGDVVTPEISRTPLGTEVFTSNKTYDNQATGTYFNPIIPKGFYPVNENGANWGTADGYKKGLVIEDAVGNQYVWVPVDGTNVKFKRYEFGTGFFEKDLCSEELPEALSSSVTLNQGFYIARFEAGVSDVMKAALKNANNGTEVTKLTSDTTATYGTGTYLPVSKQGAMVWNMLEYDDGFGNGALKVASSLYPESSSEYGVVSTLIYGAQWDTALKFIGAYNVGEEGYATYATNSTGMGNYSGTNGGDTSTATPDVCGALDAFRQKNIYDMAGNVYEWTNEDWWGDYHHPVIRSGGFDSSGSDEPASRRTGSYADSSDSSDGFRVALYIRFNSIGVGEGSGGDVMTPEISRTPLGTEVFTFNKTYDNKVTGTYFNPIIPKGFYPVNKNGADWGTADGYKKGLVIEDAVGNQYVWVPVDGTNVKFERYEFGTGFYKKELCSEELPEALSWSVKLNQGFYIARFEAGVSDVMKAALKNANNGTEVTELTSDTTATYGTGTYLPVSKQGAMVWSYIKYDDGIGNGALKVASSLYPESSNDYGVVSTLIYGAQWDTALKFIGAYNVGEEGYATYATNSTGMGNYYGTNRGDTFATGAAIEFRQKNIYDMAGNFCEWTNEEFFSYYVYRGGSYVDGPDIPASYRMFGRTDGCGSDLGFRVALYIRSN